MLNFEILEDFETDGTSKEEEWKKEFNKMSLEELKVLGENILDDKFELETKMEELSIKSSIATEIFERKKRKLDRENKKTEIGETLHG